MISWTVTSKHLDSLNRQSQAGILYWVPAFFLYTPFSVCSVWRGDLQTPTLTSSGRSPLIR